MSTKKTFRIPVVWTMMGYEEVEAENIEEACHKVMSKEGLNYGLPDGDYLDESYGIDREGLEDYEEADPANNLDCLPQEYWK